MNKTILTVSLIALFLSGCASTGMKSEFRDNGLPKPKYYVGGGYEIYYRAPVNGTAYLVEVKTGKIIMTESLDSQEMYDFEINPADRDTRSRLVAMGLSPDYAQNMNFELYFVPLEVSDQNNQAEKP